MYKATKCEGFGYLWQFMSFRVKLKNCCCGCNLIHSSITKTFSTISFIFSNLDINKKVLLCECKRHTARRVVRLTPPAD